MKINYALLLLSIGLLSPAHADLELNAPGVPVGTQKATKLPDKVNTSLTNAYKFVFSGIEAKSNTSGAPGNSANGNGGLFHLWATVASPGLGKTKEGKLDYRDEPEFLTAPLRRMYIVPAEVFRATGTTPITINIEWKGTGNAKKPDGYFNILGEYQKNPPPPTGSLTFPVGEWMLQSEGGNQNPAGIVKIIRE